MMKRFFTLILCLLFVPTPWVWAAKTDREHAQVSTDNSQDDKHVASGGNSSIIERGLGSGSPIVIAVLLMLLSMSVATWAIFVAKWIHLRRLEKRSKDFLSVFWESRSLKELNSRLSEFSYSPLREVFRSGYTELLRNSHLKDQVTLPEMAAAGAMDNLKRSLHKAKISERRQMERFLSFLAISASACPFIGLFGTVWGIMSSFEGIAQSGSTSLATVAPGISEALIATAFGLAAAIPAVIGYNIASQKIRSQLCTIDIFSADFLNIIERFFVSDRTKQDTSSLENSRLSPGV